MTNRLDGSLSPYLLQHADNPVEWWPWCDEALAEARRRSVPVLLSVGYAACHWCHVMAHESFSDPDIAALMNERFVNIKVDREERPDIDAVYMQATQAMTGQGGWPMTCFLTPDGEPFYCGTYYPPRPRQGMPSFRQVLDAVTDAWTQRHDQVRAAGAQIAQRLRSHAEPLPEAVVDAAATDTAVDALAAEFDAEHGGFGTAPKFPPTMVLEFLLRHHERTGSRQAMTVLERTTTAMARGGIYDQLAGGFARYSTDREWVVPHFEKMLYDNAQLLRVYTQLASTTGSPLALRIADETATFLLDELRTVEGGFAAALDADTDGVEGLTYVWTPGQLGEAAGEDAEWAAAVLGVTEGGTFERGASVLQLPDEPTDRTRWQRVRSRLLAARRRRPQPARDDKVVAAWNGLAITALAGSGRPAWVAAAAECADYLLRVHRVGGTLRRTSLGGVAGPADGVLEDYGCLAEGLLAMHQATGARRWLDVAVELIDDARSRFAAGGGEREGLDGAYYDTADDAERLFSRPADVTDNVTPSGASSLAGALLTASALVGPERAATYRAAAESAIARAGTLVGRVPRFAGHWLSVAEAALRGPVQVAIVGSNEDERAMLLATARGAAPSGSVVLAGEPDADGAPLLAGRPLVDGGAAAYVCRGYVCDRPVTTSEQLRALLAGSRTP